MKINQAVEFFVNGLDRKITEQKLAFYGKDSVGSEDMLAKIFNFGNNGAYSSVIKGEREGAYQFSLGIPKHRTNAGQKVQIDFFCQELIELKKASISITEVNIGCSLFIAKNVHLNGFYSVLDSESTKFNDIAIQQEKQIVNLRRQKPKNEVEKLYRDTQLLELEKEKSSIDAKLLLLKDIKSCSTAQKLSELLKAIPDYTILYEVLTKSVKTLFSKSIEELNVLSREDLSTIKFELVPTNQPHVEISALNKLLKENSKEAFKKFTVGLDCDREDAKLASCPGCSSYFEGVKQRDNVNILYISHNQLPRDFNLNGISEQRQNDFLLKFKDMVLSIFPKITDTLLIHNDKDLIIALDKIVNNGDNIFNIFDAYGDLSKEECYKKASKYLASKIDRYLSKEIGDKFYNAAQKFKGDDKVKCEAIFNDLVSVVIHDLLSQYSRIKGKDPKISESIQKYIFSKFDEILPSFEQYKGENTDKNNGLYKNEIEYSLELIKKSLNNDLVKEKIVPISDIKISKYQKLYIINPEGDNSKFIDTLTKSLKSANIINAHVQLDNSTCADHSLIILTKMLQFGIPLSQIGITSVENKYGKHANLYIIADNNIDLSNEISRVINFYKKEEQVADSDYDTTVSTNPLVIDNLHIENNTENIALLGHDVQIC